MVCKTVVTVPPVVSHVVLMVVGIIGVVVSRITVVVTDV